MPTEPCRKEETVWRVRTQRTSGKGMAGSLSQRKSFDHQRKSTAESSVVTTTFASLSPNCYLSPGGHIGNTGGRGSAMARETMNYGRGLGFTGVGSGERGWLGAERVQLPKEP